MRIVCLVLGVFVILLSSVPCCTDDSDCGNFETEQAETGHHHEPDGQCNNCSPFFTCSTCSGFVYDCFFAYAQPLVVIVEKKHKLYIASCTSCFYGEFWQPPKLN